MAFQQFLTALVSFTGVLVGYKLAGMTKEELKPGRKYFIIGEKVMLLSVFVPALSYSFFSNQWVVMLLGVLGLLSVYVVRLRMRAVVVYLLALLSLASLPHPYFVITAGLLFIYGFPLGTLLFMGRR